MPKSKSNTGDYLLGALASIVTLAILFFAMPRLLLNLSHISLSPNGDGIKNIYTFLYHIKFDHAWLWFDGMNYPFGDHIVFTDNQPFFAILVKWLTAHGLPLTSALGIFNSALILSFVATPFVIFQLARRFRLPPTYSFFCALCLTFMAPQIPRLQAHFGLAYTVFVPALWLLYLRWSDRPTIARAAAIGAWVFFFGGLHLYNLLIGLIFLVSLWLWRTPKKNRSHFVIQVVLPLLLFAGWLHFTDPIHDRGKPPIDFFYRSYFEGIFVPYEGSPFRPIWEKFGTLRKNLTPEGISYAGMLGILMLFFTIIRMARYLKNQAFHRLFPPTGRKGLSVSLYASILVLLFAMGYPWRWGLERLLPYFGPLIQFRSLGRFAWVFWYVYLIFCFYAIYIIRRHLRTKGHRAAAAIVVVAAFGLAGFEAFWFSRPIFTTLNQGPLDVFSLTSNPPLNATFSKITWRDYQALLPLPFVQAGAANYLPPEGKDRDPARTLSAIFSISMETGLPIMGSQLSRTSVSEALALEDVLTGGPKKAKVLSALPSSKPILVIVGPENLIPVEKAFLNRCHFLVKNETYAFYRLDLKEI